MSENVASEASSVDPLKTVADAMETAVQAARAGAVDARAAVDRTMPAVTRFVSRFIYTACYTVSYGVVFPTVFLARSVPKDNPIVHGLVDGAQAAIDMVGEMQSRRSATTPAEPASSIIIP
jgi:hypothetical protein